MDRGVVDPEELVKGLDALGGARLKGSPKKVGLGTPEIPSGPPVKVYQLSRMMRIISRSRG